jgi:hypothetical protein
MTGNPPNNDRLIVGVDFGTTYSGYECPIPQISMINTFC